MAQTSPWALESIVCTTAAGSEIDLTTGGVFPVVEGETTACVITNRRLRGSIQVIRLVVNDNGGTATAGDWTMNVAATNPSQASFAGVEALASPSR